MDQVARMIPLRYQKRADPIDGSGLSFDQPETLARCFGFRVGFARDGYGSQAPFWRWEDWILESRRGMKRDAYPDPQ